MDVRTFHAGLQPDENIWNLGNIVVSFYDMLEPVLDIVERNMCLHRWFSGRMLACHAGGPGSIPGRGEIFSFSTKSFSLSTKSVAAPGEARTHNPGITLCTVYKYRALTDCATGAYWTKGTHARCGVRTHAILRL